MHFYWTALPESNQRIYKYHQITKVPTGTHSRFMSLMSFLTSQRALPAGCISAGPRSGSVWYQKPARLTRLGPRSPQRSRPVKATTRVLSFFFFNLFIFERARTSWGRAERRDRRPSRLHTTSTEPDMGLELTNHKIVTGAKMESQKLN